MNDSSSVPVLKKDKGGNESEAWINYRDILGWGVDGHRVTCFTLTDQYYWPCCLEDFEKIKGYERTERGSVIKMDKVEDYNPDLYTFHFSKGNHEPYVNVSRNHRKRLKLE